VSFMISVWTSVKSCQHHAHTWQQLTTQLNMALTWLMQATFIVKCEKELKFYTSSRLQEK